LKVFNNLDVNWQSNHIKRNYIQKQKTLFPTGALDK